MLKQRYLVHFCLPNTNTTMASNWFVWERQVFRQPGWEIYFLVIHWTLFTLGVYNNLFPIYPRSVENVSENESFEYLPHATNDNDINSLL